MLEEAILKLIASVDANTAALIALAGKPEVKAKAEKPAAKPAPKVEEPKAPTATVSSVIEAMLKANKRKAAIDLLAKYNATSASGIAEGDTEAFIEDAQGVLLT